MLFRFFPLLFLILGVFFSSLGATERHAPATILASGNNKFVLPVFVENFYRKYPEARVVVQYGASGDLASAILSNVGYDIFLSADMAYPKKVYLHEKAVEAPKEYARGSLILFIPSDTTFYQKRLEVLKAKKIKHITIANRATAPYGKAAMEVLKNSGIESSVKNKIRYSTNISTVITNVIWYDDAGFLSKSAINSLPIAYRKEGVNWVEIDQNLYTPIVQGYVVSEHGSQNINAIKFLKFMHSDEGRAIYREYGYK